MLLAERGEKNIIRLKKDRKRGENEDKQKLSEIQYSIFDNK